MIKNINLGRVLNCIRKEESISRVGISKKTELSQSTCSVLTDELIRKGLVIEVGKDQSSGGRKPILLRLNYSGGRALGLKLMEDRINGALVDLSGKIIGKESIELKERGPEESYLRKLKDVVARLLAFEGDGGDQRIFGIGIGIGGRIDYKNGLLLESSILDLHNVPLCRELEKEFGYPVYLENDVNAFTIGEKFFGAGRDYRNFLCLSVGRGIGAGIIIEDKLYRGSHHAAGEFGHMRVSDSPHAPVCSCGKWGCLEALASDLAIIKYVKEVSGAASSLDEIREKAKAGDRVCLDAFKRAGHYLGVGIATLINLFDPEILIIGGEGVAYLEYYRPSMQKAIQENSVYGLSKEIEILPLLFEDDLWVKGVATLVIREVFSIPL